MEKWDEAKLREKVGQYAKHVKVLLPVGPVEEDRCEGIWVMVLSGDEENGFGLLDNAPFEASENVPTLGDFVEYKELNPEHKPYIIGWGERI